MTEGNQRQSPEILPTSHEPGRRLTDWDEAPNGGISLISDQDPDFDASAIGRESVRRYQEEHGQEPPWLRPLDSFT
jgi:hypothetical protein